MSIAKKVMKMLKKCNSKKENSSKDTSDTCLHYKIDTIKQIKKILNECKKNEHLCKWNTYHFPKSFLLVIQIADNEISLYLEEYFKIKYGIYPDDLQIVDIYDIYKLNIDLLQKVLKPKDPLFYDIYIKYTSFMDKLNDVISNKDTINTLDINDLENYVNTYISHTNEICQHLLSLDDNHCNNCVCNNLNDL